MIYLLKRYTPSFIYQRMSLIDCSDTMECYPMNESIELD